MAGYKDTYQLIINALMGRENGTEIQPANHQAYALSMLEYIRSVELLANSPIVDLADSNTHPVQSDNSYVCYLSIYSSGETIFHNFHDENGNPITINSNSSGIIILIWNTQYWSYQKIDLNTGGGSGGGITIDSELSSTSENPVQNKVINAEVENRARWRLYGCPWDKVDGLGHVFDIQECG